MTYVGVPLQMLVDQPQRGNRRDRREGSTYNPANLLGPPLVRAWE